MLEDFLSKLGASTKITVGVSVSPSIGLEMIEIDRTTGTVNKYAYKPLEYNHSTREITDYSQFEIALEDLFEELHIPKKSNIIVSIPTVFFGMIQLPILLTDEAITNAIISEVEQSYIFKRQKPVVGWSEVFSNIDTENRTLAYTAVQETVLDGITQACDEIGCTLVGLEPSYASLLRALHYTNVATEQMQENVTWNLMIIGQNSYSILSIINKKIIDYYEEPLALKSFVDDEIYNAIMTSAKLTLVGLPANHLFIISEADLVSAEVLSMKLSVESKINFLECNKYAQNELLPVNLNILPKKALQVTLESIGATVYPFCEFPIKLNLLQEKDSSTGMFDEFKGYPRINVGNLEVELTPDFIKKISLILGAVLVLPMIFLILFLGHFVIPKEQTKLDYLNSKIKQTTDSIAEYADTASKENSFDLDPTINKICAEGKLKLTYYGALGVSIPNKLWITYYLSNEAGKIDVKGNAANVASVYTFYKNIKQLVNNSDIKLHTLEIGSGSLDDVVSNISSSPKYYNFEITNMGEAELNPPAQPPAADGTTPAGPQGQPAPGGTTPQATKSSIPDWLKPKTTLPQQTPGQPSPSPSPSSSPQSPPLPSPGLKAAAKLLARSTCSRSARKSMPSSRTLSPKLRLSRIWSIP